MRKINKILFPTDFSSCANQALPHALYLAEKYQAELHMLHGIVLHGDDPHNPMQHFPNVEEVFGKLKKNADVQMTTDIQKHEASGLNIKKVQERDIAASHVILNYAKDNDIDLIVMGTHGRRGLGYLFLGSVADEVIRKAPCPVLTIREQKEPKPVEKLNRILVPIDYSEHAKKALSSAKEIAALYDARLELLHVIEESVHPAFYASGKTSIFDLIPDIEAKSKQEMEQLFKEVEGPEVAHEIHIVEGRAARDIVEFAENHDSDLIVIATHGLTGIDHFLLGSVAEKVIRRSPCPVFTVKVFGKSILK